MSPDSPDQRLIDRLRSELERSKRRTEDLLKHALETQRRLDALLSTRTWRISQAVGQASSLQGLGTLPSRLTEALMAPPGGAAEPANPAADSWRVKTGKSDRLPTALIVTAFVSAGGAERVALDLMESLAEQVNFALAFTEPSANDWEARFRRVCSAIERVRDVKELEAFAAETDCKIAVISSTGLGYQAAPALEGRGLRVFDIVHNSAEAGWVSESIRQDRFIDAHFAVGAAQRKALADGGVPESKILLSPNGVDVAARFNRRSYLTRMEELRVRFGIRDGQAVVCWVGRLSPEKDPLLFVETIRRLAASKPDADLRALMLGDGPERLAVEGAIRKAGLTSTIETLGVRDDTAEALAVSDIFVLPSAVEGSPITLLEAMSMGCAAAAADVGAVSEVLQHRKNGLLVSDRSAAAFGAAIAELLDNPDLRDRLGAAARATVAERFNAADSLAIYKGILLKALDAEV